MSKPLFFTGRKEIARSDVAIRLIEQLGKPTQFEANVDLSRYSLPADAIVVVEAYHTTYLERFLFGTVARISADQSRELVGLEPGDRPLFRVKVIAPDPVTKGQLLAAIDSVRPDADPGSLLPIVPKGDMGDEFWRVVFVSGEEPAPELWINKNVHGLLSSIQNHDPFVTGMIMPDVFRQVLRGFFENGETWTDEGRAGQWLFLAQQLSLAKFEEWDETDEDGSRAKRRDWIEDLVRSFATFHHFSERYHEQLGQPVAGGRND